jgi:hypothetical protein
VTLKISRKQISGNEGYPSQTQTQSYSRADFKSGTWQIEHQNEVNTGLSKIQDEIPQ